MEETTLEATLGYGHNFINSLDLEAGTGRKLSAMVAYKYSRLDFPIPLGPYLPTYDLSVGIYTQGFYAGGRFEQALLPGTSAYVSTLIGEVAESSIGISAAVGDAGKFTASYDVTGFEDYKMDGYSIGFSYAF